VREINCGPVPTWILSFLADFSSVPDPNPDPADPHVFGPPGSGSISQMYGSGSFYNQAKKVRKTLIPTDLWLSFDFLSLKNDLMYLQKVISRKTFFKVVFCWCLEGQW